MRRPKGIKTRKAVAKRFRVTASGKVLHSRAGRRHLLSTKNARRRRRLGQKGQVSPGEAHKITLNLPWNH
ncbi:MAG: 50S ribosomal protein L35 [Verrucomicrobia bacterium]|nr:50S ribosomal protein L35 [Verrucomicrobiota bacterium]